MLRFSEVTRVFERNTLKKQRDSAHARTVKRSQERQAGFQCSRGCLNIPLIVRELPDAQQGLSGRPTWHRSGERKRGF